LTTDASEKGIGAVLTQYDRIQRKENIISSFSKLFDAAQKITLLLIKSYWL
jgi:hypothetical protein